MAGGMAPYLRGFLDWLLEPIFDFAGRQLADEAGGYRTDGLCGDWPFVPRDDESLFHSAPVTEGAQHLPISPLQHPASQEGGSRVA